jgi:glycosyltransferase involved in cell wall biosynthesis
MACGEASGKWLFEGAPFTVLNNAIPVEHFHYDAGKRAEARAAFGIDKDAFVVCHVGAFNPQKNQAFLIRAFAKLVKQRPEARLLLAGDGKLRQSCEELANELGLQGRAIFAGMQADVAPALSASAFSRCRRCSKDCR